MLFFFQMPIFYYTLLVRKHRLSPILLLLRNNLNINTETFEWRDYAQFRKCFTKAVVVSLCGIAFGCANHVENIDLSAFAKDLMSLTKLGFEAESLRIEKKGLSLMSEGQKKIFKAEIDKAVAPDDAGVNLATAKTADSN